MKRMSRCIFNALAVLSLVLCVTTAGLWVRSSRTGDVLNRDHGGTSLLVRSGFGRLLADLNVFHGHYKLHDRFHVGHPSFDEDLVRENWLRMMHTGRSWGFDFDRYADTDLGMTGYLVRMPDWSIVGVFSVLPVFRLIGLLYAMHRKRLSLCPTCGYDLRGTPDRCPECGNVPMEKA